MDVSGRTLNFCLQLKVHHYFLLVLASTFLKGSTTVVIASTVAPVRIHLHLETACDSSASLAWTTQDVGAHMGLQNCELTYYLDGKTSGQVLDMLLDSHSRMITLFNLSHGESYTTFIVCAGSLKTNEVSFVADSQCKNKDMLSNHTMDKSDPEDSVVPSFSDSGSFDMAEWFIAVTVITVGFTVAAVIGAYIWRKHQRRQRILRIFRQGQNDPFQALYSPTQDSYSF